MIPEMQWMARQRQQELLREVEQVRLHRLAAGPRRKPAKGGLRRIFERSMR